ncbi:Neuronal pentraxin-1 [Desmophyllum pertusum]|uniref:Neuronal pentraxin-1 n=1 Tax=Desmophyllum pertusum TaxID=174260 RepID=A0A9W9YDX2_9CNID|nr:Neuronal pentraxin-1 [Desmophyllum pertusum]
MNLASLGCLTLLLLLMEFLCYSDAEEDPDHIFSGDAVLFAINETTSTTTSWLACSKNDCDFSKREKTENVYTHARKVFHIYGKGRLTTNDPIRYGDEVALFYRVTDEGDGLWLGCASGRKRCGLGTCPGLPHLNHWMWNSNHSCDENKFVVTGSAGLKNDTLSGQPVRIEHHIQLIRKFNSPSIAGGKRRIGENSTMLIDTPFLDNFGNWVINKDMIAKCGNKHYDVRYKVCDRCGSESYVRPKYETWKCCAGKKPYNAETSLCCEGNVSNLHNTRRSAKEARCCSDMAFFADRQVCCQGNVRDLPGQDTDADDTTVQCCGSEPYLSTHGICCNDVIAPFFPLKLDSKDALECCDDQGFNNRTSFCYSCGKKKHVLPLSEKKSWSCCKNKEIYKDEESRCCDYGVEKEKQCKCMFQNSTYISGQRFSEDPTSTSCRSCICNDGNPVCQTVVSCPPTLPSGCTFYPANDECCPIFHCFNSKIHNYKLFLRRKSHVSISTAIPELTAMTISFWMKTQQSSEGTILSYATQSQPDELVITTHPTLRVILKGSSQDHSENFNLNDGNWHFLWIEWESSNGHLSIREGQRTIGPLAYTQTLLEEDGYFVLGQRQQSQKHFIEAKAFVGEISHVNIWNEKRTDFEVIRKDCIGLHTGSIFHMSDDRIDTHHSASIIAADMCLSKLLSLLPLFINQCSIIITDSKCLHI